MDCALQASLRPGKGIAHAYREIVERYNPQESVKRLVGRANEQGGTDNITAVVD